MIPMKMKPIFKFRNKRKQQSGAVKESVYVNAKFLGYLYQLDGEYFSLVDKKSFFNKIQMCMHLYEESKKRPQKDHDWAIRNNKQTTQESQ